MGIKLPVLHLIAKPYNLIVEKILEMLLIIWH